MCQRRKDRRPRIWARLLAGALVTTAPASAATSATFQGGVLTVFGDAADNAIVVSRNAAGAILVNGGAVPIGGGSPNVANTQRILIFGLNGNDALSLNEANGALPRATMTGGSGNDTLTGGSGADAVFGQSGNDTVDVNGGNGAEEFAVTANGARIRFDRVNPAPFSIDGGTVEQIDLEANGGDDGFSTSGNVAALVGLVVDGGAGNDRLLGGNGTDVLIGGDGDDRIAGVSSSSPGFHVKLSSPPPMSARSIEGQAGRDVMAFNGNNAPENIRVTANGGRVRFSRNVTMDLDDVERIAFAALGGADAVVIDDVSGTDLTEVATSLAGTLGGTAGDGQPDAMIVNATNGDDVVQVVGAAGQASVLGLAARTDITAPCLGSCPQGQSSGGALLVRGLSSRRTPAVVL